jgi:serine/threonine protein kinase
LLSTDKTLRPDCNEILERKSDWSLSPSNFPNEFSVKHFIEIYFKLKSLRKSFYYHFIESKFNNIFKKSFESRNAKYNNEFKELNLIALGNYGIVCNAMDRKSYDLFAIKKIPFNEGLKDSVMKEIQILQKLESDLVVRLESVWIEDNYLKIDDYKPEENTSFVSSLEVFKPNKTLLLHIQMELCLMTLKEVMKKLNKELDQKQNEVMTPLGYHISSEIFNEILESVDYLHKQNVIHRDLKPNNILITDGINGRFVKIADFGLATIHDSDGQTHTKYKGTIRYAAPEVMRTRNYDMKADIYSLGVILQELFNIDINEYMKNFDPFLNFNNFIIFMFRPIGEGSKLEKEYSSLIRLTVKMIAPQKNSRPNCEKILLEKSSWALDLSDLKNNYEFKWKKMKYSDDVFHSHFIEIKSKTAIN